MSLLNPDFREHVFADLKDHSVLSTFGGLVAPILMMAIYGAIPGALIMGIAGMMRANHDAAPGLRFSLRTLLIGMTLIAVVLGLAVWVIKK